MIMDHNPQNARILKIIRMTT